MTSNTVTIARHVPDDYIDLKEWVRFHRTIIWDSPNGSSSVHFLTLDLNTCANKIRRSGNREEGEYPYYPLVILMSFCKSIYYQPSEESRHAYSSAYWRKYCIYFLKIYFVFRMYIFSFLSIEIGLSFEIGMIGMVANF